jgi:hypothetical protein
MENLIENEGVFSRMLAAGRVWHAERWRNKQNAATGHNDVCCSGGIGDK